jgi:hypothetical protein
MPKRNFSAEQIVTVLRQIEVLMAQGKAAPVACREAGVSQQSYYRWRKNYGGLELDQARRMRKKKKTRCEVFLTQRCRLLANACIAASHS